MSEINIDAGIVKNEVSLNHSEEKLVEMSNGCICCTLREDLLLEVNKLAKDKKFDYLVIESTGISEPLPVAETFTFADEEGVSLSDVAKLDTMVTVVDAVNFLKDYEEAKYLKDSGESLGEDDDRSVADLLVDQIEFADVLLVSKTDLVEPKDIEKLEAILKSLNTHAQILPISQGQVDIEEVLNTGLFDFERAQQAPGWLKEMRGEHVPETEEYGITSFVYCARKPFDPSKVYDFFNQEWPGVMRSKGFFWISSRPEFIGEVSQAGAFVRHQGIGRWWTTVPKDRWPKGPNFDALIDKYWNKDYGDRRQEIVFIGLKSEMNEKNIRKRLDACLIKNYLDDPSTYHKALDPFPAWFKKVA